VDLHVAKERGIPVRNVPDYCLDEVADHTMALMLALQRQVVRVDRLVRTGVWKITPPDSLPPLRKNVLGLIGFGRIGQLVAERARAFGMKIVAYDPLVGEKVFAQNRVHGSTLDELLISADIISLHLPLTEDTRHMMNPQSLARMKPTALLVNTSRGGLVDSEALAAAVEKKTIAGAALDVFEQEPLPQDHALMRQERIIITSHIAWYSNQSLVELQRRAAMAAAELLPME
jgi:D-3-phosphoglycerate dehydrogenase